MDPKLSSEEERTTESRRSVPTLQSEIVVKFVVTKTIRF